VDQFFGFISGVRPKVFRHFSGESDSKEEVAPIVGAGWKDIWSHGASPCGTNILRTVQGTQETVVTAFKWLVGPLGPGGCGSPGIGLCRWAVSETDDKNRPKLNRRKGTPLYHLSPRDIQKGGVLKPQRHRRERPQREPNKGRWTHQEDVRWWMGVRAIGRLSPGQSRPQGSSGVSWNRGPTRISGETHPKS
jgi:hypothetical protein